MSPNKRKHVESTAGSQEVGEPESGTPKRPRAEPALAPKPLPRIGNSVEGEVATGLVNSPSLYVEPHGLLRLPVEIQEEILDYLQHPTLWTTVGYDGAPVVPPAYSERNKVLRALASTCATYRRVFLPRAWRHVLVCTIGETDNRLSYYKTVGNMLERKCRGLMKHPELGEHVQYVYFFPKLISELTLRVQKDIRRHDTIPNRNTLTPPRILSREPPKFAHLPRISRTHKNDHLHPTGF